MQQLLVLQLPERREDLLKADNARTPRLRQWEYVQEINKYRQETKISIQGMGEGKKMGMKEGGSGGRLPSLCNILPSLLLQSPKLLRLLAPKIPLPHRNIH